MLLQSKSKHYTIEFFFLALAIKSISLLDSFMLIGLNRLSYTYWFKIEKNIHTDTTTSSRATNYVCMFVPLPSRLSSWQFSCCSAHCLVALIFSGMAYCALRLKREDGNAVPARRIPILWNGQLVAQSVILLPLIYDEIGLYISSSAREYACTR